MQQSGRVGQQYVILRTFPSCLNLKEILVPARCEQQPLVVQILPAVCTLHCCVCCAAGAVSLLVQFLAAAAPALHLAWCLQCGGPAPVSSSFWCAVLCMIWLPSHMIRTQQQQITSGTYLL
jgi:hypothetical protein